MTRFLKDAGSTKFEKDFSAAFDAWLGKDFDVGGETFKGEIDAVLMEFDARDLDNDEIKSGALDDWLKENDELPMLWSHMRAEVIGKWTDMKVEGKLLKAKGQLSDVMRARDAIVLFQDELVTGVSIGFNSTEYSYRFNRDMPGGDFGVDFTKIQLREASLVLYPAAPRAEISALKEASAQEVKQYLVEKGMSDAEATRITGEAERVIPAASKSLAEALAEIT